MLARSSDTIATSSPRKKLFVGVDLDYTQFNFAKCDWNGIHWIGSRDFWLTLYAQLTALAECEDTDVIIGIITAKERIDSIVKAAAFTLKHFIQKHNAHMYRSRDEMEWCLINLRGELTYVNLTNEHAAHDATDIPADAFSHFHVVGPTPKPDAIKSIAAAHGIHSDFCILLDDSPHVLQTAAVENIRTVSFECFHPTLCEPEKIDDLDYVTNHLTRIKSELFSQFQLMLKTPHKPAPLILAPPLEMTPVIHTSMVIDLFGTIHSTFEKNTMIIPDWFLEQNKNLISCEKKYYMTGTPILIKHKRNRHDNLESCVEATCDALSNNDIIASFPTDGSVVLFDTPAGADEYMLATRIGDFYRDDQCRQSAIFEVSLIDSKRTSRLQTASFTYQESFRNEEFWNNTKHLYIETNISNVRPHSVQLRVATLAVVYMKDKIELDPLTKMHVAHHL